MESIHQIWNAVMRLTTAELLRLRLYAEWRVKGIGRSAQGRDATDLLEEAIVATATREQPWKDSIDLCSHLVDTMRIVSRGWNETAMPEYLESELTQADGTSPFDRVVADTNPEGILQTKETLEQIRLLCSGDIITSQVVELLAQDLTPTEIQHQIPISQRHYRSAIRQIRLKLQKSFADSLLPSSQKATHRSVDPSSRAQSSSTNRGYPKTRS